MSNTEGLLREKVCFAEIIIRSPRFLATLRLKVSIMRVHVIFCMLRVAIKKYKFIINKCKFFHGMIGHYIEVLRYRFHHDILIIGFLIDNYVKIFESIQFNKYLLHCKIQTKGYHKQANPITK